MLCLLKATQSSSTYIVLVIPLQLTAPTYLLAWSSRERLKLVYAVPHRTVSRFILTSLYTPVEESTVFDEVVKKHPDLSPAIPMSLINPDTTILQSHHSVIFDRLDGDLIHCTAVCIEGSAGPSGVDALG